MKHFIYITEIKFNIFEKKRENQANTPLWDPVLWQEEALWMMRWSLCQRFIS